jgi:hypothetical protein
MKHLLAVEPEGSRITELVGQLVVECDPVVEEQLRGTEIHRSNTPVFRRISPLKAVFQLSNCRLNLPPIPVLIGKSPEITRVDVDEALQRARAITYDFEALPFSAADCYRYWDIADTYAAVAADRATSLAEPTSRPTVFNLQLSLLIALLEEYTGSWASNTYQEYLEVAGELLRTPAMMIQLAIQEHDRQVEDAAERILAAGQQTLSDSLEDIVDIPGINVDTEAALSDGEAQRLHDQVQQQLDDI